MTEVKKYEQEQFRSIVSPLRTWEVNELNSVVVYQYLATYNFPRVQENMLYIFDKSDNSSPTNKIAIKSHINDVLYLKKSNSFLIAAGDYDGGMYFEGELLLWDISSNNITSLIEGRQFSKCYLNPDNEVEVEVYPQTDECPRSEFVDSIYKLPENLDTKLELLELEFVSEAPHISEYNPINNYFDEAAEKIKSLSKNQEWIWQGYTKNIDHIDNFIVATFENYGVIVFNENLEIIKRFPIGLGAYVQILKSNSSLFIHRVTSELKNFSRDNSIIYKLSTNPLELNEAGSWEYSRVNICKEKILMLSDKYHKRRKIDYKIIDGKSSKTNNFQNSAPILKPIHDLQGNFFYIIKSLEYSDTPKCEVARILDNGKEEHVIFIKDFLPANSGIISYVIDDMLLIYGTRIEEPKKHHPTSFRMYNLKTKQIIWTVDFAKNDFLQIKLVSGENLNIYCLTNNNEIEVYSLTNGNLLSLLDFNEYTESNFISFTILKKEIFLGDCHGRIICINLKTRDNTAYHGHAS